MKCIFCGVWTEVKATRGTRRSRQCANGHRFFTVEIAERSVEQRDRQMADAVVLGGKLVAEVAREFGGVSDSYVSRCVKKYHPGYATRAEGQRKRRLLKSLLEQRGVDK